MSHSRLNSAIIGLPSVVHKVYPDQIKERIAEMTLLHPQVLNEELTEENLTVLSHVDVLFATWGMPALSEKQLAGLPRLKAVFYAAGSVRQFGEPLLKKGILLSSAWQANAIPVAEFTVAAIVLGMNGYYRNNREYTHPEASRTAFRGPGNFGETVSLLGAGAIGRKVIELLAAYHIKINVFDPYLTAENADILGVRKVSLDQAFQEGFVVSNHLANIPDTVGMLRGHHLEKMRPNAVFINTGRGATVNEPELIDVLTQRQDLTALLDVTEPEPPVANSPLYTLRNVLLSSHIAGSQGDEVVRMAEYALSEFNSWQRGEKLKYQVTLEMLPSMA